VQAWYISFHGGDDDTDWNNIHVFDLAGKPLGKALATHTLPGGLELRELRGFEFGPDGALYVANAYQHASQVLRFTGDVNKHQQHEFIDIFVSRHQDNPGLAHPFDVSFGPDQNLYVPSQDTNVVGRYYGPHGAGGHPGQPMPFPEALAHENVRHLPPGTFVPSAEHVPEGVRTVRRTLFGPGGDLFVADRDSNSVKRYETTSGKLRAIYKHHKLEKPVHLVVRPDDGAVLVGSREQNAIFVLDPETEAIDMLVKPSAGGLDAPAGMAIGPDGKLYVCSRKGKSILRFDPQTGVPDPEPFISGLRDYPEFISLVERT
jgi:DNA-binding beta-propeller fold protein YncE